VTLYSVADQALASVVASYIEHGRWPEPEPRPASLGPIYRLPSRPDLVRYCRLAWLGRGRTRPSPPEPDADRP
jgi:hypothetical protein